MEDVDEYRSLTQKVSDPRRIAIPAARNEKYQLLMQFLKIRKCRCGHTDETLKTQVPVHPFLDDLGEVGKKLILVRHFPMLLYDPCRRAF